MTTYYKDPVTKEVILRIASPRVTFEEDDDGSIVEVNLKASSVPGQLTEWSYTSAFRLVSATRDANSTVVTASIVWPDGTPGVFTTDTASVAFPGSIDAWHATYSNKTITQPLVTRDSNGAVTAQPAITIT